MPQYIAKPTLPIEANQWFPSMGSAFGVEVVNAVGPTDTAFGIMYRPGRHSYTFVNPGDYIIHSENGYHIAMPPAMFEERFQLMTKEEV